MSLLQTTGRPARATRAGCLAAGCRMRAAWMLIALATAVAAAPPADPPLRVWGEVTGAVPAALEAQLVSSDGATVVATAAARLDVTTGAAFYSAEWRAPAVAPGVRLALRFRAAGATPSTSSIPFTPRATPALVHVRDGAPALPEGAVLLAEAALTADAPRQLQLWTVLALDGAAADGSVRWRGRSASASPAAEAPPASVRLGGVAVSKLSVPASTWAAVPALWSATWRPDDAREPRIWGRTISMDIEQSIVDNLGAGGALPEVAPLVATGDAAYALAPGSVTLLAGQMVSLHLQTTLAPDAARAALAGWSLSAPGAAVALPLSTCTVRSMPGGAWVGGTWLCPAAATLAPPALVGPKGSSLPGAWRVRRLARFELHSSGEEGY